MARRRRYGQRKKSSTGQRKSHYSGASTQNSGSKSKSKGGKTALEDKFAAQLRVLGIPFETQVKLIPGREHRVDFFFPQARLAVEIQGGTFNNGGHVRGAGYAKDCEKFNLLTLQGFRILKGDTNQVKDKSLLTWTVQALNQCNARPIVMKEGKETFAFPGKVLNRVHALILEHKEKVREP